MEPITASLTFATIVGLVSNFKSERTGKADDEYKEFVDWLNDKRHRAIVKKIQENHALSNAIENLLRSSHEDVVRRLESIDSILEGIASKIPQFSEIASATSQSSSLSDQAESIIRQFVESEASFMVQHSHTCGIDMIIGDGERGNIEVLEPRFLEDDMQALCDGGLVNADKNSQGDVVWKITRNAVKFVGEASWQTY